MGDWCRILEPRAPQFTPSGECWLAGRRIPPSLTYFPNLTHEDQFVIKFFPPLTRLDMMLIIDGVHAGVYRENVGYHIPDYESGFDLLTHLVLDHWTLESAIIADEDNCVSLPIGAFDGQFIRRHIIALQQQWNELLRVKPALSSPLPRLKSWHLQLDTHYGELLTRLEKLIFVWRIRINKLENRQDEPFSCDLINQYQLKLENASRIYQHTVAYRYQNWQQLQRLEEAMV